MARFRSVSQYYDSLVAGGETRVKALGVGKTVFHSSLSNFVGSSVSPVVEDGAAGATWSGWSATQRDFYIIGPDGSLIHKVNLSPGFFAADIDAIVQAALAALSAGGVGCPGDVNSDGVVDVNDLLALLSAFGTTTDAGSDITGDGLVDVNDLLQCLSAFGNTCTAAAAPAPAPVAAVPCALGGDCGGQVFNSCGLRRDSHGAVSFSGRKGTPPGVEPAATHSRGQHMPLPLATAAAARGALLGLAAWVALLEGRGMGNIWWRRRSNGRKGFSPGGLWAFAVAPVTRPRMLWHPTMWRHNWILLAAIGGLCGATFGGRLPRQQVGIGAERLPLPSSAVEAALSEVAAAPSSPES